MSFRQKVRTSASSEELPFPLVRKMFALDKSLLPPDCGCVLWTTSYLFLFLFVSIKHICFCCFKKNCLARCLLETLKKILDTNTQILYPVLVISKLCIRFCCSYAVNFLILQYKKLAQILP